MRISDWSSDVCSSDLITMKYKINTLVTRDFSALTAPTGNLYEAVAVISKRARQVALHMKEDLDTKLEDFISDDTDELQDEKRSEERRVGKVCVSRCRSRWSTYQ